MVGKRAQFTILMVISIIVIAFTVAIYISHPDSFERFFGNINPFFIIPGLSALGAATLIYFLARNGFEIFSGVNIKRIYPFYLLAVFLAAIAVVIDIFFTYPEDTHIRFPYSIIFYN